MTHHDEELGFPGNREIVERALRESTTQELHLAAETGPRNRTLAERAADVVRGFERRPADARPEPPAVRDFSVPAESYATAPAQPYLAAPPELDAILAEQHVS
ncbi:MAG TPA: hypothetical protein VH969_06900 [Actinophytocola sp.]|jgi:hypothetical protein|uniref:hypothetical protein n=1 Tax=Actinophytocola sp. TaxID=1872138 RepID=UPI002F92703A